MLVYTFAKFTHFIQLTNQIGVEKMLFVFLLRHTKIVFLVHVAWITYNAITVDNVFPSID